MTSKRTIQERLDLFCRRAVEIDNHPFFVGRVQVGMIVRAGGGPMTVDVNEPDDTVLTSLLLKLRPFLLQEEDAYLPRILNLATRTIDDPELVHAIESGRHGYDQAIASSDLRIVIDGHERTPKAAAELYLYSKYHHSHLHREVELGEIVGPSASLVRYQFLEYVAQIAKVISWTSSVLATARDRSVLRTARLPEDLYGAHPHVPEPPEVGDAQPLPSITLRFDAGAVV